jgi:hypothetical protein
MLVHSTSPHECHFSHPLHTLHFDLELNVTENNVKSKIVSVLN